MAPAFILLVDDEPLVCGTASMALEHRGHKVQVMHGGKEALNFFASHCDEIDLVVTDVHMPGMSGTEMAWQMRQARGDLPVLFITGGDDHLPVWTKTTCGILLKPFLPNRFVLAIENCLGRRPDAD
jgi:DNA-binding response OmpR family regulator